MALDFLALVFSSFVDLLRGSFVASIPIFIAVLIGLWLKEKIKKKYRLSWVKSVFAATYILSFILIAAMNLVPWLLALGEQTIGTPPPDLSGTILDSVIFAAATIFLLFAKALAVSLIILPLCFIGAFVSEAIEKRFKRHSIARIYAAAFIMSVFVSVLLLFVFPWALGGIIYLVLFTF